MENENQVVKQKSNKGVIVLLVIIIIILLGITGYLSYDKFISNTNSNTNTEKTSNENNNDGSININLSDEDIKNFMNDGGTQPLLGIYYNEPKEIINLTKENDNYLSGMRAIEYCVEQTESGEFISENEKSELSKKYNEDFSFSDVNGNEAVYSFNSSVKGSTIQKIFEEKTGYKISNEEIKKMAANTHYLEQYDKYYYWVSDAFYTDIKINSITKENNLYKVNYTSDNKNAIATLKYNNTTKKINIISNQK